VCVLLLCHWNASSARYNRPANNVLDRALVIPLPDYRPIADKFPKFNLQVAQRSRIACRARQLGSIKWGLS
jgi:hypothetical protein